MALRAPTETTGVRRSRRWRVTTYSGVALLVLVTVHMVAHHFVVDEIGGLRTYAQVLDYIANPVILVIECTFLDRRHDPRDAGPALGARSTSGSRTARSGSCRAAWWSWVP